MFNKLFSNNDPTPPPAAPAAKVPDPAAEAARLKDKADWDAKLPGATGNDEALLALAKAAPHVDVKLAAVNLLAGEEALKSAEREFRTHDRRVHQVAKQRLETAVATREARDEADRLIEMARIFATETKIPANRLVELDHAWQAIDRSLLAQSQTDAYGVLWTALSSAMRERGEVQLAFSRWSQEVKAAVTSANATVAGVTGGKIERTELAGAVATLHATMASMPAGDTLAHKELTGQMEFVLEKIAKLEARLNDEKLQKEDAARLGEQEVARQRQAQEHTAAAKEAHRQLLEALTARVAEGEAALAAGHLAETSKHLVALDEAQDKAPTKVGGALAARIGALQAEYARLKGWQHWGGGIVRDELVLEAEALAKAATAENAKIAIKQHADAIESLRTRWKELDRLGGATSRALWKRFEEALKTAFLPVAAQHAKLKAARQENLQARNKLLDALDQVPFDDAAETHDWRELARVLEHFQADWRKLGPVEHTVPHKAREALLTRMKTAMARLEEPLAEVRRVAQLQREKLVARARELSVSAAAKPQDKELIGKVRELQNEWQQHAKSLPLQRHVENVLWGEFKAATDGVFTQRDAAFKARDAELKSHHHERMALIGKLAALNADSPAGEIRRTLADVESAWRRAGEAPRADAAKLDARYRAAREAAQKYLAGSAHRQWQVSVDALSAKMALCEEIETGGTLALPAADADARWAAQAPLPAPWETALAARFKAGLAGESRPQPSAPDIAGLLLQIESALDMPSPPEFSAARRDLKLRAMKQALEARQVVSNSNAELQKWLATVVGASSLDAGARGRLLSILSALRAGTPRA